MILQEIRTVKSCKGWGHALCVSLFGDKNTYGEFGPFTSCTSSNSLTASHLLCRRASAVFAMSSRVLFRAQVARRMVQTPKKMSSTQIAAATTCAGMLKPICMYTSTSFVVAPVSTPTTQGDATMNAAYVMMMPMRTTLNTPDLPPAEDRHHSRQPRHRRRRSERCAAPLLMAVAHWSWLLGGVVRLNEVWPPPAVLAAASTASNESSRSFCTSPTAVSSTLVGDTSSVVAAADDDSSLHVASCDVVVASSAPVMAGARCPPSSARTVVVGSSSDSSSAKVNSWLVGDTFNTCAITKRWVAAWRRGGMCVCVCMVCVVCVCVSEAPQRTTREAARMSSWRVDGERGSGPGSTWCGGNEQGERRQKGEGKGQGRWGGRVGPMHAL
jgi:hypothetical protein